MLRVANLVTRAGLLVFVALVTFLQPWPRGSVHVAAQTDAQIAAFVIAAVLFTAWSWADCFPAVRGRYAFLLPYVFGTITVTCAVASVTRTGGNFIDLSMVAALQAGGELSLAGGWIVAGLGIVAIEAVGVPGGAVLYVLLGFPGVLLAGLLLGRNRYSHRVAADKSAALLAKSELLREEQARVAALDERARIAREIHDVLAHSLGALGVQIQLVRAVLTDQGDTARAVDLLDQAHRMVTSGLGETRRAVHALRGETLPLAEGLAELSADHQRRHGARVSFEVTGVPRSLPPDAGLALTRTAQEALVNTAKHAPRQPVEIRLDYTGPGTSLEVRSRLGDGGPGRGETGLATVNGGYGLAGMRERLLLLDGTLSAGPSGREWVVVAGVPQ
jgi:signal transduction histidine kinase